MTNLQKVSIQFRRQEIMTLAISLFMNHPDRYLPSGDLDPFAEASFFFAFQDMMEEAWRKEDNQKRIDFCNKALNPRSK